MEIISALFSLILLFFISENPRWLVVRNKNAQATRIFEKFFFEKKEVDAVASQVQSNLASQVKTDWYQLLRPGIFTAVIVGVCIAILGQFMGVNVMLYYGPSIFEDAGMTGPSFRQVLVGIVNCVTAILAMNIIDKVGRKRLIYYGVSGMILSLLMIAFYFVFTEASNLSVYFMLSFFLFYVFCCAISINTVVWVLFSEMYPSGVGGTAISIAGFALWIGTYLAGQLTPWMLTSLAPAGTFIFFAIMCLPYMFIMWEYVPETAGMSLEEIERYWTKRK